MTMKIFCGFACLCSIYVYIVVVGTTWAASYHQLSIHSTPLDEPLIIFDLFNALVPVFSLCPERWNNSFFFPVIVLVLVFAAGLSIGWFDRVYLYRSSVGELVLSLGWWWLVIINQALEETRPRHVHSRGEFYTFFSFPFPYVGGGGGGGGVRQGKGGWVSRAKRSILTPPRAKLRPAAIFFYDDD